MRPPTASRLEPTSSRLPVERASHWAIVSQMLISGCRTAYPLWLFCAAALWSCLHTGETSQHRSQFCEESSVAAMNCRRTSLNWVSVAGLCFVVRLCSCSPSHRCISHSDTQWCRGKFGAGWILGGLGAKPPAESRGRAPGLGSGGRHLKKLKVFFFLDIPKEGPFLLHLKIS